MSVISGSGSKIYISDDLPATHDKNGFNALTWVEIKEVTSIGEFGRDYSMIEHSPIDKRQTVQIKGNFTEGSVALAFASVPLDAGQILVNTASKSDDDFSFKIVRTDGVIDAFTGKVTAFKPTVQGGSILSVSSNVSIQTEIIDIK